MHLLYNRSLHDALPIFAADTRSEHAHSLTRCHDHEDTCFLQVLIVIASIKDPRNPLGMPMHTFQTGRPPIVDHATWQQARAELLAQEKAHTRQGDAIAAARRRLPMVEFDASARVSGRNGLVPFIDLFQGRDELLVYKHMWHDGAPHHRQCSGCTTAAWHLRDAPHLRARGVSFAVLTTGRWDEVS